MTDAIKLKSLAPILLVEEIGVCLPFWERLGFSVTASVPDVEPFQFAIVAQDGIEVMLQTRASVEEDTPGIAEHIAGSVLYLSVASLEPVISAMSDTEIAVPRRTTFYGADEISFRDAAGNIIGFAAPAK